MSLITGISGYDSSLWQWPPQTEGGASNLQSALTALAAGKSRVASTDAATDPAGGQSNDSTDLENQIRSAVLSALQGAEQSGETTDLKNAIYSALVQVLKAHGIDPKTLRKQDASGKAGEASASDSQAQSGPGLDASTRSLIAQMLTALNGVSQSFVAGLMSSANTSQGSEDLSSLLARSQSGTLGVGDGLAKSTASQKSNQDLVGFLFDSGT